MKEPAHELMPSFTAHGYAPDGSLSHRNRAPSAFGHRSAAKQQLASSCAHELAYTLAASPRATDTASAANHAPLLAVTACCNGLL